MVLVQWSLVIAGIVTLFSLFFIIIFSGLEFAYLGANRLTIELKRKQQNKSALALSQFFSVPERFWAVTTLGLYLTLIVFCFSVQVATTKLLTILPAAIVGFEYTQLLLNWILASALVVSSISYFGKRVFEAHPEGSLVYWSGFVNTVSKFAQPLASFASRLCEMILLYLFNIKVPKKQSIFERIDADAFLQNSLQAHNDDNPVNRALFEKVIQLSQVKVRKCLIPRNEVFAIEVQASMIDLRAAFVKSKQSKIIIFDQDIDHVIGYVHHIELGKHPKSIKEIMHTIPTVPQTMNALDLIHLLTKERKSIAWVIDEFGGTAGIITMEDALEEIFGDIRDEYDIQEYTESQIAENEFIFSGRLKIDYLKNRYKLPFETDDMETLSGYIIKNYTLIPKQNTKIIIDKMEFEVLLATAIKVETVKVKLLH